MLTALLTILALAPWMVQHGGFGLSSQGVRACGIASLALLGGFLLDFAITGIARRSFRILARERAIELGTHALLLLGLADMGLGGTILGLAGWAGAVILVQADLAILFTLRLVRLFRVLARARVHFARVFVASFLIIILAGTFLLWGLPGARAGGRDLRFVDALFTATSATCVTGLVVQDTATEYSRFGQSILLILIQVGGLGLMTFAAFFAMALGQGFGLRGRALLREVLNVEVLGRISRVLVAVVAITFVVEGIGAAVLYDRWVGPMSSEDRAWNSLFHSVSAFCNAGFALLGPDSLTAYRADPIVNAVILAEIVLGGLGFVVILNLLEILPGARHLMRIPAGVDSEDGPRRLGVQTRIVLVTSLILILVGAALYWLFERGNPATLGGLPAGERAGAALFQSITARTAGFNTVDTASLRPPSALLTIVLMFVGASPGSTGGGIKTVTFVVVLMTVIGFARGRQRPEILGRSIPFLLVSRAVVILSCYAMASLLTLLVLTVTEPGRGFLPLAFETISAFGTVGLSMGITPGLSDAGKLVLSAAMLVGRIGPLTLVVAMAQSRSRPDYDFPEARLMIG